MDNESIYERQLIDRNCNDCVFMKRDMEKFKLKKNPSRINYGFCNKKKKEITFMPNYCQPENEDCFKHRK